MGRKSKQRRANSKRIASQSQRVAHSATKAQQSPVALTATTRVGVETSIQSAVRFAFGAREHKAAFLDIVRTLTGLEDDALNQIRPSPIINGQLVAVVTRLYESGWQPSDIAHVVKREWNLCAGRLAVAIIAAEARSSQAAQRAPHEWLAQLDELGAFDATRGVILGGYDHAFTVWSKAERMHSDETLATGLQVLAQLLMSPRQPVLMALPSTWGASNRGTMAHQPSVVAGAVDAKALKLIRALLSKAEGTTFEAEAEAFTAKAQEMMTRYSIDAAVLASAGQHAAAGKSCGVHSRRVHIDSPYADEKAGFLAVLAQVNGARSIWSPQVGAATVMGFPVDLQLTDLLFTSLLFQATKASAEATAHDRRLRTPSFRRAFLVAFADRIGERLESTKFHASKAAERDYGTSLVPILAHRGEAVTQAYEQTFPNATVMPSRRLNAYGWHAGRAAADLAKIGTGAALTEG